MATLAVGQRLVELAGLGVDDIGAQRTGVAPEERIVQGAVAPVETRHMQSHQQHRERVDQPVTQPVVLHVGEECPVRQRVAQVAGQQNRFERLTVTAGTACRDADERDCGQTVVAEAPQDVELALGEASRQLLQRDVVRAHVQEAHHVAMGAGGKTHAELVGPHSEGLVPRQGQQAGLVAARTEAERYHPQGLPGSITATDDSTVDGTAIRSSTGSTMAGVGPTSRTVCTT